MALIFVTTYNASMYHFINNIDDFKTKFVRDQPRKKNIAQIQKGKKASKQIK